MTDWLIALVLGVVEGLTEFIPVSSTAHIKLLGHFLGFESPGNAFFILIQLGAVLAILTVYAARILALLAAAPRDPATRRFLVGVVIAFLPAAAAGVLAHDLITEVLLETPELLCTTLILGGVALLVIDRRALRPRFTNVTEIPLVTALCIGLFQCLALVPGVSRSGATIAGALVLGCDRRVSAEFSFYLAMPTMAGAFAYSAWKSAGSLAGDQIGLIGLGFLAAFVSAVVVVRALLDFVGRHGFAPFAWWRIAVGTLGLVLLWV